MLYHKFITLSISCIVQVRKMHNNVIHSLTRKHISYLSSMQSPQYQDNSNYSDTENDKMDKIPLARDEYLNNNTDPILREKLIKHSSRNKTDPYLIDDNVSNEFITLIKDDLLENMCYVIELNPSYGLLTRRLLDVGVPFIHLYECRDQFYQELQSLKTIFPNRVNVTKADLLKISRWLKLYGSVTVSTTFLRDMFNDIPKRKWEEKSNMQVIGTVTKCAFIRHLILSIIFQTSFMMHGRAIFYLALSPSIWNVSTKLTCRNKRNVSLYTMFNILFNSTMFGTLDRRGFLPMQRIKKSRTGKLTSQDDDELFYVVKLEPKSNVLSLFGGREELIHFWHFTRHYLYKPSMKIIPTLEKIMPGFGLKLIEKDYNIFTQFNELSINQIIDVYMELRSYPGFNDSSFPVSGDDIRKIYDPFMEVKCN